MFIKMDLRVVLVFLNIKLFTHSLYLADVRAFFNFLISMKSLPLCYKFFCIAIVIDEECPSECNPCIILLKIPDIRYLAQ